MAAFVNIADDIKNGEFKKIYYVYGPEAYLKRYYINELKKFVGKNQYIKIFYIFNKLRKIFYYQNHTRDSATFSLSLPMCE